MGSENSTDSVSFASNMAYRLRAGFRRMGRSVVVMVERIMRRPISQTTKMRMAMSATLRSDFVWEVTRGQSKAEAPALPDLYVRVTEDVPVEAPAEAVEETIPEPIVEKVYNTPSYATVSATSSGAMMYEFSSSRFDLDALNSDSDCTEYQPEVVEAPVFTGHVETGEEREQYESLYEDLSIEAIVDYMDTIDLYQSDDFYESLYEDLEVDAVLEYMDTTDLYASEKKEEEIVQLLAAPSMAGYIEAPVSNISGYLSAPACAESEEEKEFYESLYEDLEVDSVLDYMDSIELYAKPAPEYVISEISGPETCETVIEMEQPVRAYDHVETIEEMEYFDNLYFELTMDTILDYMESNDLEAKTVSAPIETDEEKEFFESLYEDLEVDAVLDYMDTIELYAKPAPEYVISEITVPETCETTIEMEQPVKEPEYIQTVFETEQPVKLTAATQFIFGFDTPAKVSAGATRFRFFAEEEEDDDDTESVQVMTYSGDAAVSAQSTSGGSLAL